MDVPRLGTGVRSRCCSSSTLTFLQMDPARAVYCSRLRLPRVRSAHSAAPADTRTDNCASSSTTRANAPLAHDSSRSGLVPSRPL